MRRVVGQALAVACLAGGSLRDQAWRDGRFGLQCELEGVSIDREEAGLVFSPAWAVYPGYLSTSRRVREKGWGKQNNHLLYRPLEQDGNGVSVGG